MENRFAATPTPIDGVLTLERQPRGDDRGWFERLYCVSDMAALGIPFPVRQINRSMTAKRGTLRGLHFQRPPQGEAKCITCLKGKVLDVAVDLRAGSPTFLHWHGVELDAAHPRSVLLPVGVAHGFQTLTDDCELLYLQSHDHAPAAEDGLNPFEPRLGINWPLPCTTISARDRGFPLIDATFAGLTP